MEALFDKLDSILIGHAKARGAGMEQIGRAQMNCDIHGPFMATGVRLRARDIWSNCPECAREADEREKARQRERREKAEQDLKNAQMESARIPTRFSGKTLASFKAESVEQQRALSVAQSFVADWSDTSKKGSWLVFSGLPGTGKSHLAIAILQALMPAHVGRYMTCMELIQSIRSTWRKDSEKSEVEILDELSALPLLVIDEVGVQYGTDSEQNHIFDVLDRRYRDLMPTILLTNQDKEGFRAFVGDRVYDRMTECARWVPFAWPSYRPQVRKEIKES